MKSATWYAPLLKVASLGSQVAKAGSLGGLHQARKEHLGQFWTTDELALFMWKLAQPAMARAALAYPGVKISLLDNSVGAGRLFQFADPESHTLAGADVHRESVEALAAAAEAAGFTQEFAVAGMEALRPEGFAIGLINPPFSLHLESPLLSPLPCTTWGKYGRNTSAVSHAYALEQALTACDVVLAVVPRTYADQVREDAKLCRRLVAQFNVPGETFAEENARVRVSVLAFGAEEQIGRQPRVIVVDDLASAQVPDLDLRCPSLAKDRPRLRPKTLDADKPVITMQVTGTKRVRVVHDGRRIGLKFGCGLVQAKVLNAVFRDFVSQPVDAYHRYPKGVTYTGQALLDVEAHLAQPDPLASFERLLTVIRRAGGRPSVEQSLKGYLASRRKEFKREKEPLRHIAYLSGVAAAGGTIDVVANDNFVLDASVWGSPVIKTGEPLKLECEPKLDRYTLTRDRKCYVFNREQLGARFTVKSGTAGSGWQVIHEGLLAAFPEQASTLRKRAIALGITDWLTWDYQLDDLIELTLKPQGTIDAWEPGMGKARLALALCLLSGCRRNLVVVEAGLLDEMEKELGELPIPTGTWQVIKRPSDTKALRKINIISYERLRSPVHPSHERRTYARLLRRRIGILVADEGDRLHNWNSQQTRALRMVSARKKYVLTGTPISNYPRDLLPLLVFAAGEGTAAQPFGYHRPYLEPRLATSMDFCVRGVDAFREKFVTTEWVTNEFKDDLTEGAKREIPKISSLGEYRQMHAAHLKRRLVHEPDCAKVLKIPVATKVVHRVEWDPKHLAYYLSVAEEFAQRYRSMRELANQGGRNLNFVVLLARIGAVQMACNYPQHGVAGFMPFSGLTSKQAFILDRLETLTAQGHKSIAYFDSPRCVEMMVRKLAERGIEGVPYHGNMPRIRRTRELNSRFRYGKAPVLVASLGVTQKGLNIPQADRVLFGNRSWTYKIEKQAGDRVLRPQQRNEVEFEYFHLPGSIDEYQAQMVAHKADAAGAGIDHSEPEFEQADFLHLDTLLGRFVDDLAELYGCASNEVRFHLAKRA
jgi:hypothetical protein